MGYELNKLMNQYGVSSPTLSYSGAQKPVQPTASTTFANDTEKANYDALMAKYNKEQAAYQADKSVYDTYAKQYQDRLTQTPMYGQKQFNTLPQASTSPNTQDNSPEGRVKLAYASIGRSGIGQDPSQIDQGGFNYWVNQLKSGEIPADKFNENFQNTVAKYKSEMPDDRYTQHVSKFKNMQERGTQWDSPLALPVYQPRTVDVTLPSTIAPTNQISLPSQAYEPAVVTNNGMRYEPATSADYGMLGGMGSFNNEDPYEGTGKFGSSRFNFATGGAVKTNYADGGEVDNQNDGFPMTSSPFTQVAPIAPVMQQSQPMQAPQPMNELIQKYNKVKELQSMVDKGEMPYAVERKLARERAEKESEAFNSILQNAINNQSDNAPSKAELYFRLAAAFGAPTKTGNFMESVSNAAMAGAQHKQAEREAMNAGKSLKLQYALEGQKTRMANAKEDEKSTQAMALEEMKNRKELANSLIKDYTKTNDPQSTAGKQAIDEGFSVGTPAYQKRVKEIGDQLASKNEAAVTAALGNLAVAQSGLGLRNQELGMKQQEMERKAEQSRKLTPQEVKIKEETQDLLNATTDSLTALKKAYALNPKTFDSSLLDTAQRKLLEMSGSTDPKVLATREQENLLQEKALSGLKGAFGGNPTEGERKIMLDLQGIGAKSKEERARIMQNAFEASQAKQARLKERLKQINAGTFRNTIDSTGEE